MFGAVEKEIMGTTAQLRTSVTDIRRFFKSSHLAVVKEGQKETEEGLLPSSSAIFLKLHPFSMPASIEILSESVKCLPLLDSIKVFINRNSFHVGA